MQFELTTDSLEKRLLFLAGLLFVVTACVPSLSPNPLAKALEPTPWNDTAVPDSTVTPKERPAEVIVAPTPGGKSLQPQLEEADIDLSEVKVLLPPDAIPAILPDKARMIMIGVAEAEEAGISADLRIIGVSINGDSRAYPIPFLSAHEIVNDVVGGEPITATW